MASWATDASVTHPIDFRLVANGFVSMFWSPPRLDEAVRLLDAMGYRVASLDAEGWTSIEDFYDEIAEQLAFPDYFGRNLEALNDCLSDVASGDYGWSPSDTGLVLVLRGYNRLVDADPGSAQAILDVFANQARFAMLVGNRLLCLVQTSNPRQRFEPVGASNVSWNDAEWLDSARGL